MKKCLLHILIISLFVLATFVTYASSIVNNPNEVLVIVNGENILRQALDKVLDKSKMRMSKSDLHLEEEKIINDLITQTVLKQFIKKENIQIDPNRIKNQITTFTNNRNELINILEINFLYSDDENTPPTKVIPWHKQTPFVIKRMSALNKKIYFGENKKTLINKFFKNLNSFFSIAIQIIYINENGDKIKMNHDFGKLRIDLYTESFDHVYDKNEIKIKLS